MKKKTIIFVILAIIAAVIGFSVLNAAPATMEKLSSAVYIEDGKVLPENEGKLVVVSGTVEADIPVLDELTGAYFDALKVDRIVEEYTRASRKNEDGVYEDYFEWRSTSRSNETDAYKAVTAYIYPDAWLGEFVLSEDLFTGISAYETAEEFDRETLELFGYNTIYLDGKAYITDEIYLPEKSMSYEMGWQYEGAQRISYKIYSVEDAEDLEFTFVGIQKGSTIVPDHDLGASTAYSGIKTIDELIETEENSAKVGAIVAWVIAALFLFVGFFKGKKKYVPTEEDMKDMEKELT